MPKKPNPHIVGKRRNVPIDKLKPNPWNPNLMTQEMMAKEVNSIETFGFVDPLTVRTLGEDFEIIDGEQRWKAAQSIGLEVLPVEDLGELPDEVAQQLTLILNELHGEFDTIGLAKVVESLRESVSIEELIKNLPYTEDKLNDLHTLMAFQFDFEGPEDEGVEEAPQIALDSVFGVKSVPEPLGLILKETVGMLIGKGYLNSETKWVALKLMALAINEADDETLEKYFKEPMSAT